MHGSGPTTRDLPPPARKATLISMAYTDLDRLSRIFTGLMAPLLAGSACGIDESQFTVDVCSDQGLDILATVEPALATDYLELRSGYSHDESEFERVDEFGSPCAGASDPTACAEALAALPTQSELRPYVGSFDLSVYHMLAYTRGDEVGAVGDLAGLRAFLGSIDAPGDAALLALESGQDILCGAGGEVGPHPEGFVLYTTTGTGCGRGDHREHHVLLVRADGTMSILDTERIERGQPNCSIGRLPPGLCRRLAPAATGPVGAFFAEVAHLEAASVPAFAQLARELALHGAPSPLIGAALRARDDERRHARMTARLARRFGGRPTAPRLRRTPPRPLVEVLADNAAEGCVRETYGALVAHVQARRSPDRQIRQVLARIAGDETRHAALSWSLARWARGRMSAAQRLPVARAAADAVDRLEGELLSPHDPQVHALAGLPEPAEARALFGRLRAALRAEAAA